MYREPTQEEIASRRAYMETLVRAGEAATGHNYTAEEISEMVCVARRTWQRFMSGQDCPPRSVLKLFCLEFSLAWEKFDPARESS